LVKFLKLIQNEYIKSIKKVSTKIIFVITILSVFALMGIAKFAQHEMEYYEKEYMTNLEEVDYESRIDEINELKEPGYKLETEKLKFLQENNIGPFSWKSYAAEELFSYDIEYDENENLTAEYVYSDKQRKMLSSYIQNDDWKSFSKTLVSVMKQIPYITENDYWEYEYRVEHDIPLPNNLDEARSWQNMLIREVAWLKQSNQANITSSGMEEFVGGEGMSDVSLEEDDSSSDKENLEVYLHRLDNNIEVNVADYEGGFESDEVNYWSVFFASNSLIKIVGMLIIVITGSALANEFSSGTIKFLLINPVKRWKILVSKYIMSISLGYIIIFTLYILTAVLAMLFFGTDMISADHITYANGEIVSVNGFAYMIKTYLLSSVNVVVMATLAFAISSLVRSTSLAIGISLFSMLSGNVIISILKEELYIDWSRYLLFANTDLSAIANGNSMYANHSLGFAVTVIAVHMVVFFLVAWDGFTRREI